MSSPNAVGHDMGWRFKTGDWARAGGNFQSMLFYHNIYARVFADAPYTKDVIHDYGCAEGDGTALLHALMPAATIVGFDITPESIRASYRRWLGNYIPHNNQLDFMVGDATNPEYEADVIMSSHTLEHIADPVEAIRRQMQKARKRVIVVVPFISGKGTDGGHEGAMPTEEFCQALKDEYYYCRINRDDYNTIRPYHEEPGQYLQEGNVLMEIVK